MFKENVQAHLQLTPSKMYMTILEHSVASRRNRNVTCASIVLSSSSSSSAAAAAAAAGNCD